MFIFKNFTGTDKKCSGCKIWKSISDFGKEKRAMNGLKPRCKSCCNKYDKEFYPKIREKKLLRDNSKYTKRIRVKKFTQDEIKAIKTCRKFLQRLKVNRNGKRSFEVLGYGFRELINKLGRMPTETESIDHKIPITWFTSFEDYKLIHHLDNLQILTKSQNSKKLNFYSHPVSFEYFEMVKDKLKPQYKNKISHHGTENRNTHPLEKKS